MVESVTERGTKHERPPRPVHERLTGCYVLAMVVAPFLALIFGINAALLVMIVTLSATTYLVLIAARTMGAAARSRMRLTAVLNAVLALACAIVLIVRLL